MWGIYLMTIGHQYLLTSDYGVKLYVKNNVYRCLFRSLGIFAGAPDSIFLRTLNVIALLFIYLSMMYCSRFQVEHTSTWNHHTLHTTGKIEAETSSRIASSRKNGGHKITTYIEDHQR